MDSNQEVCGSAGARMIVLKGRLGCAAALLHGQSNQCSIATRLFTSRYVSR